MTDQIVKGQAGTVTLRVEVGETATDLDATPTVAVAGDNGTTYPAPTVDHPATGVYTATLAGAATAQLDQLTLTWTGLLNTQTTSIVTGCEIVGAFYFPLRDLRAMPDLDDQARYTTAKLAAARKWIEDLVERQLNTSMVERYRTVTAHNTGRAAIWIGDPYPRSLLSIAFDGQTIPADQLAAVIAEPGGLINPRLPLAWFPRFGQPWRTVTVRYTAGWSLEPPQDMKDAMLMAARHRLLSVDGASGVNSRWLSVTNELGNIRLATADANNSPVGLPDVDAVICGWRDMIAPLMIA